MSETATPAAAMPEPTAGTSAGATETPAVVAETPVEAPAASSPESETPAAAEPAQSLLSDAKPEEAEKVEEPAKVEEPKAEEPKPEEAKPEETKAEAPPPPPKPETLPLPEYERFTIPEGVTVDDAKLGQFNGLLAEHERRILADPTQAHASFQELGQKLADFHVAEMREAADRYTRLQSETWNRTIEDWRSEFRNDPEIGKNRADTSLARMGGLMEMYGQSAGGERLTNLRKVLTSTGAGDNPEVLRFVNWAASRLIETPRPVAAIVPRAPVVTSRAQRLYKNTTGAA